jgi:hypothetical protein
MSCVTTGSVSDMLAAMFGRERFHLVFFDRFGVRVGWRWLGRVSWGDVGCDTYVLPISSLPGGTLSWQLRDQSRQVLAFGHACSSDCGIGTNDETPEPKLGAC